MFDFASGYSTVWFSEGVVVDVCFFFILVSVALPPGPTERPS